MGFKSICITGLVILMVDGLQSGAQKINPFKYNIQKKVSCGKGAVVSAHPLASKVGVNILMQGGNAVDAAIATQLALAVVYPGAGNIGGGGFFVAHLKNGKNTTIDYRETAPAKSSRDMYLDANGNPQMHLSQEGHLASGVPGTIAGIFASMRYAKLPFKQLIQPAIDLAEKGFAITASQAKDFSRRKNEFIQLNTSMPVFVKETDWKAGDTLVQKDLANTLKRVRDNGAKGFYEGPTAKLIVAEMVKGKGIINYDDLKNYRAKERTALEFNYRGYHVVSMPLPSSGGIILQQVLKMIESRNIGSMKFQSPESVQLLTEAERRAFADRAKYLGDADFVKVPVKSLVSDDYLQDRMKDFTPGHAGNSEATKEGIAEESKETTHLSVIDADGNAVSVTTTLNGSYGSKTVVSGAGFLLNNEMDDFSVKPGVPNMYGAVGAEANAIAPGKRMLSSMTPTIVLKNNRPWLVVGTPGGTTIPTSVIQSLVNMIDYKMSPEDAVNKPKFHHQWLPDEIDVEDDFDVSAIARLEAMGYKVVKIGNIGRTELIEIKPGTAKPVTAIADKRGDDSADGY
ncbi:MAG: gamma-glutamyltransferase [Ferruginibacter sp.]|nr:gamma-glutamyltransferase [Ferruginibacter sp.]